MSADSDRWIASLGDDPLAAGFGGEPVDGVVFGVPFNPVDGDTPTTERRDPRCDPGRPSPAPIRSTDPAYIESMPTYGFDNHYVALDQDARRMWELIGTTVWFGRWQADAGAQWDLDSLALDGPCHDREPAAAACRCAHLRRGGGGRGGPRRLGRVAVHLVVPLRLAGAARPTACPTGPTPRRWARGCGCETTST